jgi:small subunit ribosomal protein S8
LVGEEVMSITDPVADLLTRIRNGYSAKLDRVDVPASRLKASIVKVLRDEGYLKGFKLVRENDKPSISIFLKYDSKGNSVLRELKRVSKPGLRKYVGYNDVTRIRSGAGLAVLSTSQGVMTSQNAKGLKLGGEYICEVW